MNQQSNNSRDSFIPQDQPNIFLRCLRRIDIFSFIPVPKDESISTRQSLVGSVIFFTIFLSYVIYDFVKFVNNNPPIQQTYRSQLDQGIYQLPRFAIAFMYGDLNNQTEIFDDLFTYQWQIITKSQGSEDKSALNQDLVTYIDGKATNFDLIPWMNSQTKQFYSVLRANTVPVKAQGLLYSTNTNTYGRVKVSYCVNSTNVSCISEDMMQNYSNYGRFFLFVENIIDTTSISREQGLNNGNNFLLYNFFVIPQIFKRITINFQVVKTQILPDYLSRWSTEENVRLQVESIFEQPSVVNYTVTNTDAISFNMQLSPTVLNNRVTFTTLIDHISMWGALWGVLFTVFAIFFLNYNKKRFYQKNPDWDRYKQYHQRKKTELL